MPKLIWEKKLQEAVKRQQRFGWSLRNMREKFLFIDRLIMARLNNKVFSIYPEGSQKDILYISEIVEKKIESDK